MIPLLPTATDVQDVLRDAARQRRISLNMTQADLAERSGVSLGSLKRFERTGEVSLASLLALAEAMDSLEEFTQLFPAPEVSTLADLEVPKRKRARSKRHQS